MIFNSLDFFIFLPIVYFLYLRLNHRGQNIWLLLASYVFYGWWDPRFLSLIAISTAVDFFCGLLINNQKISKKDAFSTIAYLLLMMIVCLYILGDGGSLFVLGLVSVCIIGLFAVFGNQLLALGDSKRKKLALWISMCTNLGLLAVFKYFNFFIDSAESLLTDLGFAQHSLLHLNIILPVGISFYTFQTMSYSIDVYRGKLKPCHKLIDFALFVSYFPQLVAGPIERASNLLPRIMGPRKISWEQCSEGLGLIAYGLFKKVVIADGLSQSVSSVYGSTGAVSGIDIAIATLFFTVQIYCDFSGYSDIARGISKLLGIELMKNFRFPYFSRSPSEFWNRWHISLSSWLRDYLYISLGGNRNGTLKMYRNLMLTMLLGGLWHGAAWNFVLWGAYQGGLLVAYRLVSERLAAFSLSMRLWPSLCWMFSLGVFFIFTCYGWLLFRAESFDQIAQFTGLLITDLNHFSLSIHIPPFSALAGVPILIACEVAGYWRETKNIEVVTLSSLSYRALCVRSVLYGMMMLIFVGALSAPPADFIYFQF